MDALIFMLISSSAATLLIFVSGIYASSTNSQITTIYNYEYGGNALIALHYAKDTDGRWFWNELKKKVQGNDVYAVETYLNGAAKPIWSNITDSSPAGGENTFLCFEGAGIDCYPQNPEDAFEDAFTRTVYTSSVKISSYPDVTVIIKLYY